MIKITKKDFDKLNNDAVYHIRLTRLYDIPQIIYEGSSKIAVYRDKRGNITLICPKVMDWAEGDIHDTTEDGDVVIEDYMMEIFEI
jgi:hypothetical protein